MARVQRLIPFDDLNLIGNFASKFGMNPDWVFDNTSFGTITNFAIMHKEIDEYHERFSYIWQEVNQEPEKK